MPRGKEFCPFENDFFESKEFSVKDGTWIHCAEPRHRATDGVLVKIDEQEEVTPLNDIGISSLEEAVEA